MYPGSSASDQGLGWHECSSQQGLAMCQISTSVMPWNNKTFVFQVSDTVRYEEQPLLYIRCFSCYSCELMSLTSSGKGKQIVFVDDRISQIYHSNCLLMLWASVQHLTV